MNCYFLFTTCEYHFYSHYRYSYYLHKSVVDYCHLQIQREISCHSDLHSIRCPPSQSQPGCSSN